MTWTEIANSNYVVGTVLRDTATGADDWTSFIAYVNNNNENFFMFEPNGETEKRNTEDSNYYTLGYDFDEWSGPYGELRYDYSADFAEGDREDVLAQRVDGDLNTVLVKYDGSNNIVYAISFNRWDDRASATPDFAQFVWAWNTPAADIPDQTTVTFYGQEVAFAATGAINFEYDIDYSEADADMDPNAIQVENGTIVIKDYTVTGVDVDGVKYTGTILGEDGEYYTFSLTQNAAGTNADLMDKNGTENVTSDDDEVTTFTIDPDLFIQEFLDQFYLDDENAKIEWVFTTKGGTSFDFTGMTATGIPGNVTMADIGAVKATVTPENGDTTASKVYMDSGSQTTADQVATYKTAFKAAINDTTFPGLDDHDEDPGVIAAKEALEKAIDDCKTMDELYAIRNNATFNAANTYVKALTDAIAAAKAAAEEASKEAAQKEIEAAAEALILPELRVTASSSATRDVISAVKAEVESEISNAVYYRSATVEVNSWSAPTSGATAEAVCDITITLRSKTDSSVVTTRLFENVTVYVTVS